MELIAYDKNFNLITYLAPSIIQWNRRYYEPGDFEIQIFAEDYQEEFKYLYTEDRPEIGIIEKVSYSDQENEGQFITLKGRFMEQVINDKITWPTFYGKGEITAVIKQMVNQYKDDIPLLEVATLSTGTMVEFQSTGDELGTKAADILRQQEMAYRINYDFDTSKLLFSTYKGVSRTAAENDGNMITFTTDYGNVYNILADIDDSNYKNYAIVAGQGEGADRISVIVDISNGEYKKVLFVDAAYLQQEGGASLEDYKAQLTNEGKQQLLEHLSVKNVEFDALAGEYEYMVDYDIGTKCDIIIDEIKLSMEARIIAIYEVLEENNHMITLEFGDKIMTQYKKARLKK